jgi:hypothetical protein
MVVRRDEILSCLLQLLVTKICLLSTSFGSIVNSLPLRNGTRPRSNNCASITSGATAIWLTSASFHMMWRPTFKTARPICQDSVLLTRSRSAPMEFAAVGPQSTRNPTYGQGNTSLQRLVVACTVMTQVLFCFFRALAFGEACCSQAIDFKHVTHSNM